MKGSCDYLWDEGYSKLRQFSPTYIEHNMLLKKYVKRFYGDVLDVGCGADLKRKSIIASNPNVRSYLGIDSSAFVKKITPPDSRFRFLNVAVEDFGKDRKFDVIMVDDVIEHLECDKDIFSSLVKNNLRDGGLFLIVFPLHHNRWGLIDEESGHFRRYSISEVRKMLGDVNLKIVMHDFAQVLLLRFYRDVTSLKSKDGKRVPSGVNSVYLKVLKVANPFMIAFDSVFRKFGLWADSIWLLAEKK